MFERDELRRGVALDVAELVDANTHPERNLLWRRPASKRGRELLRRLLDLAGALAERTRQRIHLPDRIQDGAADAADGEAGEAGAARLIKRVHSLDQALDAVRKRVLAVEAECLLVVSRHSADDERDQRHVPHDHLLLRL